MGVRIGAHAGPLSVSTGVRGRGCMMWLGGALVLGALITYWYVAVPVLAVVVLSWLAIRHRDKRRAKLAAQPQPYRPQPAPQARHQSQPQFPYDPRVPQSQAPTRPVWMGQAPTTSAPQPTFTPRANAYGTGTHRPR